VWTYAEANGFGTIAADDHPRPMIIARSALIDPFARMRTIPDGVISAASSVHQAISRPSQAKPQARAGEDALSPGLKICDVPCLGKGRFLGPLEATAGVRRQSRTLFIADLDDPDPEPDRRSGSLATVGNVDPGLRLAQLSLTDPYPVAPLPVEQRPVAAGTSVFLLTRGTFPDGAVRSAALRLEVTAPRLAVVGEGFLPEEERLVTCHPGFETAGIPPGAVLLTGDGAVAGVLRATSYSKGRQVFVSGPAIARFWNSEVP
jgi:hypothetical protein